jgi:hypothetical protein
MPSLFLSESEEGAILEATARHTKEPCRQGVADDSVVIFAGVSALCVLSVMAARRRGEE